MNTFIIKLWNLRCNVLTFLNNKCMIESYDKLWKCKWNLPFEIPFSVEIKSKTTTSETGLDWGIISFFFSRFWSLVRNSICYMQWTLQLFCILRKEQSFVLFWASVMASLYFLCSRNLKLKKITSLKIIFSLKTMSEFENFDCDKW